MAYYEITHAIGSQLEHVCILSTLC